MIETERTLVEAKRHLIVEQKAFLESNYDSAKGWKNSEDETKFDKMESDIKGFDKKIELSKTFYAKEAEEANVDLAMKDAGKLTESFEDRKENQGKALKKWLLDGVYGLSEDERKHIQPGYLKGTSPQTTTGSAGGFTIDEGWLSELSVAREAIGSVRQAARVLKTATGNNIPYPKVDDTAQDAELQTEGSAITVADMAFTEVNIGAYTVATLAEVSTQLLQDEQVSLETVLNDLLALRIARKENEYFTTGTGSSQPHGVVTVATEGPGDGTETTAVIAPNDIYNLIHEIDPEYRYNPKSGFMMHDNILKEIKKLSVGSGDDRPLWVPSLRDGEPDRIDGRQYWINQNMASSLTGAAKVLLYGDFSQFLIRDAGGFMLKRLDERFAEKLNVGFVAAQRVDSRLIGPSKAIKYLYVDAT